jgi:hypothetical protein
MEAPTTVSAPLPAEPPPPKLQIGLKFRALPKKKDPVWLRPDGLAAHTAIIAQSGSGKSFMLGRFLEELVGKTKARLLILDPNGDFASFNAINEERWNPKDDTRHHRLDDDTAEAFKAMWEPLNSQFTLLSQYAERAGAREITLSWSKLSDGDKAGLLQVSPSTRVVFDNLCNGYANAPLDDWHEKTRLASGSFSDNVARPYEELLGHMTGLLGLELWNDAAPNPVQWFMQDLSQGSHARVVCVDLGSVEQRHQSAVSAYVALSALWQARREAWRRVLPLPRDEDNRWPVFVVIDEAHNLAPEQPVDAASIALAEIMTRIAMEGRKYGLFLVLVTQRPSRLNSNLLSQCDNLCLMKMSNPADVELVKDRFGFIPPSLAARALEAQLGQMVLCGQWVDDPVLAQVSPRRTVEGGRSLRDKAWLCAP